MLKKLWHRIKVFFYIAVEHILITLTKGKLLLIFLFVGLCAALAYQLAMRNWTDVQNLFQDATAVGIIGTLLGAVIGGFFSLVGSISVSKQQIKAQTQIRRKNVIYKPLYDELAEIHYNILKDNPYPLLISFGKGQQTIRKHPQFSAWGRIKADSRYLETPKKLIRVMEKLEADVLAYVEVRHTVGNVLTTILNDTLTTELEMTCSIMNIGDILLDHVLLDRDFDLFNEMHDSYQPRKDVDEVARKKVQQIFVDTCKKNSDVICLKNRYEAWLQSEEDAISLLSVMIRQINTAYEG